MKKIICIFLFIPSLLFSQWVQQYPPSDIELILSIDFANANIGAAGGWGGGPLGKAVYTTNSGVNWLLAQVPDSSRSLVKVQLIDNSTGYIAGAYNIFKNDDHLRCNIEENSHNRFQSYYERIGMTGEREDYRGLFLKTTNGGKNWFTYGNLPSNVYYLMGMKFININTGFISASLDYYGGRKNGILKTTNGGLNWNTLYQIDTSDINNIYTSDGNTIFVSGWKSNSNNLLKGMILKTSNGGNSWNVQLFNETGHISDVNFTNSSTGFAVSNIGTIIIDTIPASVIYKTTNAGVNWAKLGFQNLLSSYDAVEFAAGTGKGIAVGYKLTPEFLLESLLISRTTNYGVNWTNLFIPDSVHLLYCSSILDANIWFTAGGINNAIVYKTTNGGAPIGIEPISSEVPKQFALFQNYPNPFNPVTKIKFDVPAVGARHAVPVRLVIYDILGREIAVLVNEQLKPGTYEVSWSATGGASTYPSGVYFYRLTTQDFSETKKMVLVK